MSKKDDNYNCPNCGSTEFITEPNQYDVLIFTQNGFKIETTEQIDEYKIFCRACSSEINAAQSDKKIVLK